MSPQNVTELDELLSRPHPLVVDLFQRRGGDVVILGAGGKMGPSLTRMVRRAIDETSGGDQRNVWAVSRFSNPQIAEEFQSFGVRPIAADLMDPAAWAELPDAPLVVFMVGCKFGTAGRPGLTWASNTLVPSYACQRYAHSRIAAFSSGNVYPLVSPESGGCREDTPLGPVGEYAMSVLGRERIFQHFAIENGTPISLIRLNYAVELRYGVLVDIARQILAGRAVDCQTNSVNVIWQQDANAHGLLSLDLADSPAVPINVTGAGIECVRALAESLGGQLGKQVLFAGEPQATALLNNASAAFDSFYRPEMPVETLVAWTANWLQSNQPVLEKPTHFQTRNGIF